MFYINKPPNTSQEKSKFVTAFRFTNANGYILANLFEFEFNSSSLDQTLSFTNMLNMLAFKSRNSFCCIKSASSLTSPLLGATLTNSK